MPSTMTRCDWFRLSHARSPGTTGLMQGCDITCREFVSPFLLWWRCIFRLDGNRLGIPFSFPLLESALPQP